MTDALALYDPPCVTCPWPEQGYDADPHTNCRDTCSEYKNYRAVMDMAGITADGTRQLSGG